MTAALTPNRVRAHLRSRTSITISASRVLIAASDPSIYAGVPLDPNLPTSVYAFRCSDPIAAENSPFIQLLKACLRSPHPPQDTAP